MPPRKGPWHNARADRRYREITLLLPRRAVPSKELVRLPNPPIREVPVDVERAATARSS